MVVERGIEGSREMIQMLKRTKGVSRRRNNKFGEKENVERDRVV